MLRNMDGVGTVWASCRVLKQACMMQWLVTCYKHTCPQRMHGFHSPRLLTLAPDNPMPVLQFVTLMRVMSWVWLAFALVGIIIGAALLAAADQTKPKSTTTYSPYSGMSFSSSDLDSMASTTYSVLLAFGIILLLGGKQLLSP